MEQGARKEAFVEYLERLYREDNRRALAILRRGLSGDQKAKLDMYPFVIRFLRQGATKWEEDVLFAIASLFAFHPSTDGIGDMGTVMKQVRQRTNSDSIEGRFMAMLRAPSENVLDHLKQCVSLARSKEVPIDWNQLYKDLLWWNSDGMRVQRRWASSFWGDRNEDQNSGG